MAPRKKKAVEIWCGVLKDGSVFSVKIANDATVANLCAAIFKQEHFEDRFSFQASAVKLFMPEDAHAGHPKLVASSDLIPFLEDGQMPERGFKELRPSWKLNSPNCFGPEFPTTEGYIHVLVKVPGEEPDRKRHRTDEVLLEMSQKLDILCERLQPKPEHFSFSTMSSKKWMKLQQKLNIFIKDAVPEPAGGLLPIDGFQWERVGDASGNVIVDELDKRIPLTENRQRSAYHAYVRANLADVLKDEFLVHGVEYGQHKLNVDVPGYDIKLAGMTDILIVKKGIAPLVTRANMLIEVNKSVTEKCMYQAATELIVLDLLVEHPVMALLTNLVHHWQFFWISTKYQSTIRIETFAATTPAEGFAFVKAWINHASTITDADTNANAEEATSMPFVKQPVAQRKLRKLLPSIREEDEGDDIRESLEQYFAIAAELGPDVEMARAVAHRMVQSMPTFDYYT
jgi:hypothetical protein